MMLRKLLLLTIIIMFAAGLTSYEAKASHVAATDISYTCLGGSTYEIRLDLYRDCDGIAAPTTVTIDIGSSCLNQTLTLQRSSVIIGPDTFFVGQEVSQLCPAVLVQSTCGNGSLPGLQLYSYKATVNLDTSCSDYQFSWDLCCRNDAIDNLAGAVNRETYVESNLDFDVTPCNSSPQFTNLPISYICANQPYSYVHGAVDPDNDSLSYTLISALEIDSTPIPYVTPFTPTSPLPTASGFTFDPVTGEMSFTPTATGNYVISIRIDEFRDGVHIGSTMRDMQIVVITCTNQQPTVADTLANLTGAVLLNNSKFEMCPTDSIAFQIVAFDPDGDSITMTSNNNLTIPGSNFTVTGNATDTLTGTFSWVPTQADTGVWVVTFTVDDGACPVPGVQSFAYTITVRTGTNAGGDRAFCPAGGPIRIEAVGGSQFSWSPTAGIVQASPDSSEIWVAPSVNTNYVVTSDLSPTCKNMDTVFVEVVPDFIYSITDDTSICLNQTVPITVQTDPQWAPYVYSWSPTGDTVPNISVSPSQTTPYILTVTSDTGCTIVDTVNITVAGSAPVIDISGNTIICQGDTNQLDLVICAGNTLFDDFDPTIDATQWSSTAGVVAGPGCGAFSLPNALHFNSATGVTRQITTNPLNLVAGGSITFYLRAGSGSSPCEAVDLASEDMVLEYSTNGGASFTILNTYLHANYSTFTQVVEPIPVAAQLPNTLFRFRQLGHSGTDFDNWALDDVSIECCGTGCGTFSYNWTPNTNISDPTARSPYFWPDTTTTYVVEVTPMGAFCPSYDTVTLTVVPDFNFTITPPSDTVCKFASSQLVANAVGAGPFDYVWTPLIQPGYITGGDSLTSTIVVTPDVSTTYALQITNPGGCVNRDTVSVIVSGIAPQVILTADGNRFCPGDTAQITGRIIQLSCGPTVAGCGSAPVVYDYGNSTTAQFGTPFNGNSQDSKFQILYTAAELNSQGIFGGTITRIAFDVGGKGSNSFYENFTIKFGCTNAVELDPSGWEAANTTVFGPSLVTTNAGYSNVFNLSQPYDWDGISSLVMEICYDNDTSTAGGLDLLNVNPVPYTAMMGLAVNNGVGCSINPINLLTYNQLPNTRFLICDPPPTNYAFDWTPADGLVFGTDSLNPQVVVNQSTTYTLTVDDGQCENSQFISLNIDSSYFISAGPDTSLCGGIGDTVQLDVEVFGNPPASVLSCGTNGTSCSTAPQLATVGTGTATNSGTGYPAPYGHWFENAKHQMLFTAAELQAAGITTSGTITSLALNIAGFNGGTTVYYEFQIKMGCTGVNNLTGFQSNLSTVFNPKTVNLALGWNTHNFDQSFDWDGTSNVIVEICFRNDGHISSFTDNASTFYTTTGNTSVFWQRQDGSTFTCAAPTGTTGTSSNRPNTRFGYCPAPSGTTSINWTRSPAGFIDNPTDSVINAFVDQTTDFVVNYTFIDGCTKTDTVTVFVSTFQAEAFGGTSICLGDSAQLGASGVNHNWQPADGLSCTTCANPKASPDTTTQYIVTITDSTGCVGIDTVVVTVFDPPQFQFPNNLQLCISDSVRLGVEPGLVSYQWSPGGQTTDSITITTSGTYSVTVTDANGCTYSDTTNIIISPTPQPDLGPDVTFCSTGSVTLDAGPGFASYAWSTSPADTAQTITVSQEGTYSVTVTNSLGCPGSDTIELIFSSPVVELGNDTFSCLGDPLVLDVGPFYTSYLWSDSSTSSSITVTVSGQYCVTVTDSIGCTISDCVNVSVFNSPTVSISPDDTTVCFGTPVTFTASGSFPSYVWGASGNPVTQSITVTAPGFYTVTATDINGCTAQDTVALTNFPDRPVNVGPADTTTCSNETLILNAGGGPYAQYTWQDGDTNSVYIPTASGTYSVTVVGYNGCVSTDAINVTVFQQPTLTINSLAGDSICEGETYTLDAGSFSSYLWSTGETNSSIQVTSAGIYRVTATDANGCTNSDVIELHAYPEQEIILPPNVNCGNGGVLPVTISAGGDWTAYNWSTGATTAAITVTENGTYYVTTTDENGCETVDSIVVNVNDVALAITSNELGNNEKEVIVDATGGTEPYTYEWSSSNTTENLSGETGSQITVTPEELTTYTVTVTDAEGCTSTVSIDVEGMPDFIVPQAFTPNGDGKNDLLQVLVKGPVTIREFRIYNRWGEEVYNNADPNAGWDGKYKGKEQPVGTYIFQLVIEVPGPDGPVAETQTESITLLR